MDRISIQDIAKALVDKHGLSQNDAENFVTTLFDVLNEGLHKEKIVKIKGLGTFKVIDVRERESINVNTGERVLIDSHGKITFTPDAVMRDLINKPFAQFETVILNEGVDLDEMSKTQGFTSIDTENDNIQETPNNELEEKTTDNHNKQDEEQNSDNQINGNNIDLTNSAEINNEPIQHAPKEELTENVVDTQQENAYEQYVTEQLYAENIENDSIEEKNNEFVNTVVEDQQKTISNKDEDSASEQNQCENIPETNQTGTQTDDENKDELQSTVNSYKEEKNKITQTQWAMFLVSSFLFAAITLIIGYYWGVSSVGPIVRYKTVHIVNEPASTVIDKDTLHIIDTTATRSNKAVPENKVIDKEKGTTQQSTPQQSKPMLENAKAMVNTGAYKITGTAQTITVKKGETLKKISKFYLGDGMECYIQVHNNITDIKEGMHLKIPKLQLKKRN